MLRPMAKKNVDIFWWSGFLFVTSLHQTSKTNQNDNTTQNTTVKE
jgi:hypothetical protein